MYVMLPSMCVFSTSLALSLQPSLCSHAFLDYLNLFLPSFVSVGWTESQTNTLFAGTDLRLSMQISLPSARYSLSLTSCRQNYIHVTGRAETQLLLSCSKEKMLYNTT